MENNLYHLVKEIRHIRNLPKTKRKKRYNESDREYIFRTARYRCHYCRRPFPEKELHAVRKHPQEKLPLVMDGLCACGKCAREKGGLTHKEFVHALRAKRKEVRQEAYDNGQELKEAIFDKYNHTCIYCVHEYGYMPKGRTLTRDHKLPVSRGGTNDLDNLTCACEKHNKEKDTLTADEYFKVIDKRKERRRMASCKH